ncbi:hypothetical protein CsSME_00005775 [Camellia sinensis var. sinensis]
MVKEATSVVVVVVVVVVGSSEKAPWQLLSPHSCLKSDDDDGCSQCFDSLNHSSVPNPHPPPSLAGTTRRSPSPPPTVAVEAAAMVAALCSHNSVISDFLTTVWRRWWPRPGN